jgi:hypothetical protein
MAARNNKPPVDYAAELQKCFDQWDYLKTYGGSDPFYSDGDNMNLVRNHIFNVKRKIEENLLPEQYPDIYHRETPHETDRSYMARADEIRTNAKKTLELYKADSDYQFLCRHVPRLTEKQKKEASVGYVILYAPGLEDAINKDDLITMRRHEHAENYLDSFRSCAVRIRKMKPPENEQMNLFADYSDDTNMRTTSIGRTSIKQAQTSQ